MTQEVCPLCKGTGWARVNRDGASGVARCECRRQSRSPLLMERAGIPGRYNKYELEGYGFTADWRNESLERAKAIAERFSQEYPTSTPFGLLFMGPAYVLNYRYTENKVTILTANFLDQENLKSARKFVSYSLTERIGEPMRSRLYEMCKTVVMNGDDFRQKFKPSEHRF